MENSEVLETPDCFTCTHCEHMPFGSPLGGGGYFCHANTDWIEPYMDGEYSMTLDEMCKDQYQEADVYQDESYQEACGHE